MNKKLLLTILTILSILFYSVVCFATNENTNLNDFIELASIINEEFQILLVGIDEKTKSC